VAPPEREGKVIDLMEALRASLQRTETAREQVGRLGPRKAPKRVEAPAKTSRRKRNA
jgi:non-homologous end joining protein Ku